MRGRLVIPGLGQVLKALPPDLFPLDVIDWFLLPERRLQLGSDTVALTLRAWLLSGRPIGAVVRVSRAGVEATQPSLSQTLTNPSSFQDSNSESILVASKRIMLAAAIATATPF